MTGPELKDGGHWNPKAHFTPVDLQGMLAVTWAKVKSEN